MEKLYKILILVSVVVLTASFAQADTLSHSTPSVSPGQATPTAKSEGKNKSKSAGKKVNKAKEKRDKQVAAKDAYICPMCHITGDKPGKCPMCGMDMVKNEKKDEKKTDDEKKM